MRAVLTNFGTTGDIQPFLALATELGRAGHKPIVALSPNFSSRAAELGFKFVPVGPDLQKVQSEIIDARHFAFFLPTREFSGDDARSL